MRSESEAVLSVGGTEIIDVSLVKQFDYVALGISTHLKNIN